MSNGDDFIADKHEHQAEGHEVIPSDDLVQLDKHRTVVEEVHKITRRAQSNSVDVYKKRMMDIKELVQGVIRGDMGG